MDAVDQIVLLQGTTDGGAVLWRLVELDVHVNLFESECPLIACCCRDRGKAGEQDCQRCFLERSFCGERARLELFHENAGDNGGEDQDVHVNHRQGGQFIVLLLANGGLLSIENATGDGDSCSQHFVQVFLGLPHNDIILGGGGVFAQEKMIESCRE